MRCGHCKQIGHDRRTCKSLKAAENHCLRTIHNSRGTILRSVGWNENCPCSNCVNYRRLNLPTPQVAVIRAAEKHEKDMFPVISVENKMKVPIYMYYDDKIPEMCACISENEKFVVNDGDKSIWGPFGKDSCVDIIITDRDFGDKVDFEHIDAKNVIKFITIGYGRHQSLQIEEEHSGESKWRSAALKSRYLLVELERLGAKNNPNLEPIIDLLQDIDYPECSEVDKERAGIPSELTNVT